MDRYTSTAAAFSISTIGLFNVAIAYVAAGLAYLSIDQETILIYLMLMLIDLFTGVTAAFIRHEEIARRVFMAGLATKVLMLSVPVVIAMLVKMNGAELAWMTRWTMIVLSLSETLSILNNYLKAKGKETLPEIDAISIIAKKLRLVLLKLFDAAEVETRKDKNV